MARNTPALSTTKATGRPITTERPGAVVANMRWKAYPTIALASGAASAISGVAGINRLCFALEYRHAGTPAG
jgi:hypothetical protein